MPAASDFSEAAHGSTNILVEGTRILGMFNVEFQPRVHSYGLEAGGSGRFLATGETVLNIRTHYTHMLSWQLTMFTVNLAWVGVEWGDFSVFRSIFH